MAFSTLVSFYGPKPAEFAELIGECQAMVSEMLGESFRPYDLRQVHCTIAALDRMGELGSYNAAFHELRGKRAAMDLCGLLAFLRGMGELPIRIGGFAESAQPFLSRGQRPYRRSFGMPAGKAVIMGWPIDQIGESAAYPPDLESLRRGLQRFGVLHRYHATETDIDNDLYLRIGLYDENAVTPAARSAIEQRVRGLLGRRAPLTLRLRPADLAFAQSDHQMLPPSATSLLPITDPSTNAHSLARLFGWHDLL
jgi:hypothetical protein